LRRGGWSLRWGGHHAELGEEVMVERVLDFLGPRGLICISLCVRIGRLAAGVGVGERRHDEGSVLNF
jgi:hypothetical protein